MNLQKQTNISKHAFLWRDRKGNLHNPKDMETSYLLNVLKMIWNNTVEEHNRIQPVHLYDFGSFYTPEYMAQAVKAMVDELSTRKSDLTMPQLIVIRTMQEILGKCNFIRLILIGEES